MRFSAAPLLGVFSLELERREDVRGYFARTWCAQEGRAHGLPEELVQASISFNRRKGTLRGMHFQWPPSKEGKLVRCEQGSIYDVVIDLRPESATFLRHHAVQLDSDRGNALYIPPGLAHGFQTLADDTRVSYLMSDYFAPELGAGVRHDDPAFGISWPHAVSVVSSRDAEYPDFQVARHVERYRSARR